MADMNIREKFFDDLAKGARWDVGVSIARGNPLPLDANSVFESYEDLETYAAGVLAYPGQVVAVVNADSTVIYYLDQEKAIKPVGVIPAGDGKTIEMDENDVISLHDFGKYFYKYIAAEGDVPAHYEKVEVSETNPWVAGLEPKVTAEGLGWYEPNPTTVDGVNSQVTALAGRMTTAEGAIDAIEADYLKVADKTELSNAITAEKERAESVEEDLEGRLAVIEGDYLTSEDAYDDTALAGRVKAIEDDYLKAADKYDDSAVKGRLDVIEGDYLKAADIANMATDAEVEAAVKVEKDRAMGVEESLQTQINTIMNNPDTEGVINSINEFTQYIEEHGEIADGFRTDIDANAEAIEGEISRATTAEGLLSGRLEALEEINHDAYKDADATLKSELEGKIALKADATALEGAVEELDGRLDTVEAAVATVDSRIEAAEGRAAADAETKANAAKDAAIADAEAKYATTGALSQLETDLDARLEVLEAYEHDTYATKEELGVVDGKADSNTALITNLTGRLDGIVAQGGEPNTINTIKVNGVAQTIDSEKAVNIIMPTKFSDLSDDSGFDARITAAKKQADKGVEDAAAAQAKAEENKGLIDAQGLRITALETAKESHDGSIADHLARIVVLEEAKVSHDAEYEALEGIVSGHTTSLAGKADKTALDTAIGRIAANETAIKTLNETTIPAVEAEIAKKADASDLANYYVKSEVESLIVDAKDEATYDDTEVRGLISAEVTRATKAEGDLADEIARVDAALKAAIENEGEGLDSIKELASWIEEHGKDASAMAKGIEDNAAAIAAINHEETGILAVAKAYTDAEIAGLPTATAEALGLVKFDDATIKMNESNQLYVAKVSTDVLEQGSQTLVLNGGSAKE